MIRFSKQNSVRFWEELFGGFLYLYFIFQIRGLIFLNFVERVNWRNRNRIIEFLVEEMKFFTAS